MKFLTYLLLLCPGGCSQQPKAWLYYYDEWHYDPVPIRYECEQEYQWECGIYGI